MGEARRQVPPEQVAATLAICLETAQLFDEAAAEFAIARRQQRDDPQLLRRYTRFLLHVGRTTEARALLRKTVESRGHLGETDLAWARRHLAILETAERRPEQFARAFELLKKNEAECGEH